MRFSRGFTLFTALVGVLVVVMAMTLAAMMDQSQKNTVTLLEEQGLSQEMIDIANIARTDAMQEFNFGVRSAIEEYFTNTENNWHKMSDSAWRSGEMDALVQEFEEKNLSDSFVEFASDILVESLCGDGAVCGVKTTPDYLIRIADFDHDEFKILLKKVMEKSREGTGFVEPVNCTLDECPNGTFYLNLDFSQNALSDQEYERLPNIEVIKKSTCKIYAGQVDVPQDVLLSQCAKALKVPIVQRQKTRILVPLRVFKAITESAKIARELFSDGAEVQKRLVEAKLGVCDSQEGTFCCRAPQSKPYSTTGTKYSCMARNRPLEQMVNSSTFQAACIIPLDDAGDLRAGFVRSAGAGNFSYDPSLTEETRNKLEAFAFAEIVSRAAENNPEIQRINSEEKPFEIIIDRTKVPNNFFSYVQIDTQAFKSREHTLSGALAGTPANKSPQCTKISSVYASLVFKEHDPRYSIVARPASLDPLGQSNFFFRVEIENSAFKPFGESPGEKTGLLCMTSSSGFFNSCIASNSILNYCTLGAC